MAKRHWSRRVAIKYALLQLPALVFLILMLHLVRLWVRIPSWLIWGMVGLWVAKDVVLFPFVWRSYEQDRLGHVNSMVGLHGIAKNNLTPSGYVEVHGELWQAEVVQGAPFVESGGGIRVKEIRGLTLIVQPDE